MHRAMENGAGGSQFDDFARVHHCDLVRNTGDHAEVVADVERGSLIFLLQFSDQIQHCRFDGYIQRGGGFVHDEQGRVVEHCHRNQYALLLSARELMRITPHDALGIWHVNFLERFEGFGEGVLF